MSRIYLAADEIAAVTGGMNGNCFESGMFDRCPAGKWFFSIQQD
jgi:hypothetical protein